jgi:tetratricopeptide (TPR) repeat protein
LFFVLRFLRWKPTDPAGRLSSVRRLLALTVCGSIVAATTQLVAADARPPSGGAVPPGAEGEDALQQARRMLLERAKERYEAGRGSGDDARQQLEGALDALRLAYQLTPASWLLFNLAQVQSRLGACSEAADLYQRYLASDPGPDARASAEEALELLGSCEAHEPALDDGLSPGLRSVSSLDALVVSFGGAAPPSPLPAVSEESASESRAARVWPWVFAGLSVTSGVAAVAFYAEARAAKSDLDHLQVAGPLVPQTQERGETAQDRARVFGGFALGFAVAAGVSYWWPRSAAGGSPLVGALERLSWLPLDGGSGAAVHFEF